MKTSPAGMLSLAANGMLTPPATPEKPEAKPACASADRAHEVVAPSAELEKILLNGGNMGEKQADMLEFIGENGKVGVGPLTRVPERPRAYTKKYRLLEELGRGVWSNVYRAYETVEPPEPSTMLPPSPPLSPQCLRVKKVLAAKLPARRDAHKILEREANILTYLHSQAGARSYLVPFHGFDMSQHSILMDAVPLSLENHAKAAAKTRLTTTKLMFDPVVGAEEWSDLAEQLIGGLEFLHTKGCVHGDIKPANVLLRPASNGKPTPLYCDFSSAHISTSRTKIEDIEEVSAVTTDYASPELLESLKRRNGDRAIATKAADVFALAVTLLFAAIGESPYAGAGMEIRKLIMAREGLPLEFARQASQSSKVMKGRAVDRALRGGVERNVATRLEISQWRRVVRDVLQDWKEGGWSRGG